jgi:hypothetical protein
MPNPKPTNLVVVGPTVSFRLSASELEGVRYACFLVYRYLDNLLFRLYDPPLAERLEQICRQIFCLANSKKSKSFRIHADVLAIAAIMFGLRRIRREIRRNRIPVLWPERTDYGNLLGRLELCRKKAKRAWFRLGSVKCYFDWQKRWETFLKGNHSKAPKMRDTVRKYRQQTIDKVLTITKRVLPEQNPRWVPLDHDLRPMVRAAIRHVRRERAYVGMKDLTYGTPEGRRFLSEYVGRLVSKLFWKKMNEAPARPQTSDDQEENEVWSPLLERALDTARAEAIRQNKL